MKTLVHRSEDFIYRKIKWKAKHFNFPSENACWYDDLSPSLEQKCSAYLDPSAGMPVLYFSTPENEWTIVCTRKLVGHKNSISYDDISGISASMLISITELQKLIIKTRENEELSFYADKGVDTCTLWNIVLMLLNLKA